MPARRLDGSALSAHIRSELVPRVAAFTAARGRPPGFTVVLAGSRPESEIYVRNKIKAVAEAGCRGDLIRLSESDSLTSALQAVDRLNRDALVLAFQQIVYTLTELPNVDSVQFSVNSAQRRGRNFLPPIGRRGWMVIPT